MGLLLHETSESNTSSFKLGLYCDGPEGQETLEQQPYRNCSSGGLISAVHSSGLIAGRTTDGLMVNELGILGSPALMPASGDLAEPVNPV